MDGIAYQNKDIVSKTFADNFKGKSLKVYGINIPSIVSVLPTNLPIVEANELRIDNLFLLEDESIAIIDYESEDKKENRNKYINYIARVLKRYEKEGEFNVKLRMIVIYTADVLPEEVESKYDYGALTLKVENAFLSKINSTEIKNRISQKIKNGERLTDEELMQFIILPLTYKDKERKKFAIKESIDLAKKMQDEETMVFVLSGILVFTDKIIDEELSKQAREWISMTKVARLFEEEKEAALAKKDEEIAQKDIALAEKDTALAEKDTALAEKDTALAEKEATIARLQAELSKYKK